MKDLNNVNGEPPWYAHLWLPCYPPEYIMNSHIQTHLLPARLDYMNMDINKTTVLALQDLTDNYNK